MSNPNLQSNSDALLAILTMVEELPSIDAQAQASLYYDEETKTLHITTDEE